MLRGLAEYSMSGRRQAITMALLFGLVPMLNLLSGAIVALVTLRKGWQEGFLVMLWAMLPAGLQLIVGDISPLLMLLSALITGQALRASGSWPRVLVLITVLGLAAQLSLLLQTAYVAQVTEVIERMMTEGRNFQVPEASEAGVATPEQVVDLLLHFYGAYHIGVFVACLVLARHWQALLYNPGGFRQEFHALRLDPRVSGVLLALVVGGELGVAGLEDWVPVFCMAPLINGLALTHYAVAQRKMGVNWLVLAYLVVLIMAPIMILLGFVDGLANLRKRITPAQ